MVRLWRPLTAILIVTTVLVCQQGSAEAKPVVEPASETTLRRREHRIRRAAHFSQRIRRAPSQVTTPGATRPTQKDRRKGAHRGRQGKLPIDIAASGRGRRTFALARVGKRPTYEFPPTVSITMESTGISGDVL